MNKPTDHFLEKEQAVGIKRFKLRNHILENPGFRSEIEQSAVVKKNPLNARFRNTQDRFNIILGVIALIVALIILCLLEIKQVHDAAAEKHQQEATDARASAGHSIAN